MKRVVRMSDLYRIGGKLVSRDKLATALDALLSDRAQGATQAEAARAAGVSRSFVSNLESLGEVRSGARVALIAFPVSNGEALRELAEDFSLDCVLTFSQDERERAEGADAKDMFNRLLDTLAELNDYAAVVILASDWRIETFKRVVDADVIGIELGVSPLEHDVEADVERVRQVLTGVVERAQVAATGKRGSDSGRRMRRAWEQLKRS